MITFTAIRHCLIMFVDKDLESKIQDDLRMDQEFYLETEVETFMLKASIVSAFDRLREYILLSDEL